MFRCPHCQDAGIAPLKKAILSPGLLATCKLCGQTSSTRYTSWLVAMIPGSILMLAALFVSTETMEWTLNIAGIILMILIPMWFAPLYQEE